jgi:hypothetical protein
MKPISIPIYYGRAPHGTVSKTEKETFALMGRGALAEQEIHISHNIIPAIHQEKV